MKPTLKEQIKEFLDRKEIKPHAIKTLITEYDGSYMRDIKVDDTSFEKAHKELCKILNNFIEYDSNNFIRPAGIYLIEDFYIGKTNNINSRIAFHILECFYKEYGCITYVNEEKREAILKVLETRKLKVKLLDDDMNKEKGYIQDYYLNGYPLLNKVYVNKKIKKELVTKLKKEKMDKEIEEENKKIGL